jgi:hypothetical protein
VAVEKLVPNQFLFQFCRPVRPLAKKGLFSASKIGLTEKHRLPFFGGMDDQKQIFEVFAGWSNEGLAFGYRTRLRSKRLDRKKDEERKNGFSLWIDARDNRTSKRAGRFCSHFEISPLGEKPGQTPIVEFKKIARALDDPPEVDAAEVVVEPYDFEGGVAEAVKSLDEVKSFGLNIFLPKSAVFGFDPDVSRRIGFFYRVRDVDLGEQLDSAGHDLPYWENPSLWSTLELRD